MTSISFVFTELVITMKYGGGGFLYNLVFTEWRQRVSHNDVLKEGVLYNLVFAEWRHCVSQNTYKRLCKHLNMKNTSVILPLF